MAASITDELIRKAKTSAAASEQARQEMMAAAQERGEAVFALWAQGMTVRAIAGALGVSPSVSQKLLQQARNSRPPMERREERVSYELHRAVAEKVLKEPEIVLNKARLNLKATGERTRGTLAQGWVNEWESLLNGDVNELVDVMLRPDERSIDLRQMTPFAGVLSQEERVLAIHKASRRAS